MSKKENIVVILLFLLLYFINQIFKNTIPMNLIGTFLSCYFNDIIGGAVFIAYCNIILSLNKKKVLSLCKIELFLFICGVFWEYITPIYRVDTVSDIWDIAAYMIGGILYWLIERFKNYVY
ncbi:hypothetical protein [Anaerofustis butyriciformans]|uniref:hypothetical protein n=1 Tax=Anaerofustis butyriciformans TaxID=3108533 RepID=UPI002E335151|nr:hypothetical protein [Anaerofustis sp. HA2171]